MKTKARQRIGQGRHLLIIVLFLTRTLSGCGDDTSFDPSPSQFLSTKSSNLPSKMLDERASDVLMDFLNDASSHGLDAQKKLSEFQRIEFFDGLLAGSRPTIGGKTMDEPGNLLGLCIQIMEHDQKNKKRFKNYLFVYFDASFLEDLDTYRFKSLAYHEFSHCLLGAPHSPMPSTPLPSTTERLKLHLAEMAAAGEDTGRVLRREIESGSRKVEDYTIFQNNFYLKEILEPLWNRFSDEYEKEKRERNPIMSPYILGEEDYWRDNWEGLVSELFTSLGGH